MYDTDLEIEAEDLGFISDESSSEEDKEAPGPANLDARRQIERRQELKRLRELLDDPYLEYFE